MNIIIIERECWSEKKKPLSLRHSNSFRSIVSWPPNHTILFSLTQFRIIKKRNQPISLFDNLSFKFRLKMIKWECNGLTFLLLTFIFWNTYRSNVQNFLGSNTIESRFGLPTLPHDTRLGI